MIFKEFFFGDKDMKFKVILLEGDYVRFNILIDWCDKLEWVINIEVLLNIF